MDQVGGSAGLLFEIPLGNRTARAEFKRAQLELRQAQRMAQLVEQSIAEQLNRAWRAVQLTREQQKLTALAEEVARLERALRRMTARAERAEGLVEVQRKLAALLGEELPPEEELLDAEHKGLPIPPPRKKR